MPHTDASRLKRRHLLKGAGLATQIALSDDPSCPQFKGDCVAVEDALDAYWELRKQYVARHKCDQRLANHKVAALFVRTLTDRTAQDFFIFGESVDAGEQRVVLATFMFNIIYGILRIDDMKVHEALEEDIDYCLIMEFPENLEWFCLAMHTLCRLAGEPTNDRI
jgi:hypothetical protein